MKKLTAVFLCVLMLFNSTMIKTLRAEETDTVTETVEEVLPETLETEETQISEGEPLLEEPDGITVIATGDCGDSATWVLTSDGTLTVSGTGSLYMFNRKDVDFDGWFDYKDQVTKVVVEEGIVNTGSAAFANMPNLTEVSLPESLLYLGYGTFNSDTSLKTITIPSAVSCIEEVAFAACTSLKTVYIDTPDLIRSNVFFGCPEDLTIYTNSMTVRTGWEKGWDEYDTGKKLTVVYKEIPADGIVDRGVCGDNATWVLTSDGTLTVSGTGELYAFNIKTVDFDGWFDYFAFIKKVVVEEGITSTGSAAFSGMRELTEVVLPDTLETVGYATFNSDPLLETITTPSSVTYIGDVVFSSCKSLKTVKFGDVETIWSNIFYGCPSDLVIYTEATGPKDTWFNGWDEYEDGKKLTVVYKEIPADAIIASGICGDNATWTLTKDGTLTVSGTGSIYAFNVKTADFGGWFDYTEQVRNVVIEEGITATGSAAFADMINLESVSLPETLETVSYASFHSDSSLKTVTIPSSVKTISELSFYGCSSLKSVYMGDVDTISYSVFASCPSDLVIYTEATGPKDTWTAGWDEYETGKKLTVVYKEAPALDRIVITGPTEVMANGSVSLTVYLDGEELKVKNLEWASSDINVATVSNGKVKTNKNITSRTPVTITATAKDGSGVFGTYEVIVTPAVSEVLIFDINGDVTNNKTVIGIDSDTTHSYKISATTNPLDASKDVLFTSSNKLVTVDENGYITIDPSLNKATVKITATATDGSKKSAFITLNIAKLVKDIEVSGPREVMANGQISLTSVITPADATNRSLDWTSSDAGVATVSNGKVKANKNITSRTPVTITATAKDGSGVFGTYEIIVTPAVNEVKIFKDNEELFKNAVIGYELGGEYTLQLSANTYPADAAKTVSWSSNNKLVTVDENGLVSVPNAFVKPTTIKITATATDGSKKNTTVSIYLATLVKGVELNGPDCVAVGKNITLKTVLEPLKPTNNKIVWTSSDTSIATVSGGKVKGIKEGTVTITATAADGSGKYDEMTVTVLPAVTAVVVKDNGNVVGNKVTLTLDENTPNEILNEVTQRYEDAKKEYETALDNLNRYTADEILENAKKELDDAVTKYESASTEYEEYQKTVTDRYNAMLKAKEDMDAAELKAAVDPDSEYEVKRIAYETAKAELEVLNGQKENDLNNMNQAYAAYTEKKSAYEELLVLRAEEVEELKSSIETEIAKNNADINTLNTEGNSLRTNYQNIQYEIYDLSNTVTVWSDELARINQSISNKQSEISAKEAEIETLISDIVNQQFNIDAIEESIQETNTAISNLNKYKTDISAYITQKSKVKKAETDMNVAKQLYDETDSDAADPLVEARAREAAAQKELDDVVALINKGSYGFFETQGSTEAMAVLDYMMSDAITPGFEVKLGDPGDATSLDNMKIAIELIAVGNQLRTTDNNFPGHAEWVVNDTVMALAQANVEHSKNEICHWARGSLHSKDVYIGNYNRAWATSENLAWGHGLPNNYYGRVSYGVYDGWYVEEKENYEEKNGGQTGHYTNMFQDNPTGLAVAVMDDGNYVFDGYGGSYAYSQEFAYYFSSQQDKRTYSQADYYERFMFYYDGVNNAKAEAEKNLKQAQDDVKAILAGNYEAFESEEKKAARLIYEQYAEVYRTENAKLETYKTLLTSADMEDPQAALRRTEGEITSANSDLSMYMNSLENANAMMTTLNAELDGLNDELCALVTDKDSLAADRTDVTNKNNEAQAALSAKNKELENVETSLTENANAIERLNTDIKSLEEQYASAEDTDTASTPALNTAKVAMNQASAEYERLSGVYNETVRNCEAKETETAALKAAYEQAISAADGEYAAHLKDVEAYETSKQLYDVAVTAYEKAQIQSAVYEAVMNNAEKQVSVKTKAYETAKANHDKETDEILKDSKEKMDNAKALLDRVKDSAYAIWLTAETAPEGASQKVEWTSGNAKVATVEQDGLVLFTGVLGSSKITAKATDGTGKKYEINYKVVLPQ